MSEGPHPTRREKPLQVRMPAVDSFPEIEVTFDASDVTPSAWALVSSDPEPPRRRRDTPHVTPIPPFFKDQEGDSLVNRSWETRSEEQRSALGSWLVVALVIAVVWAVVGVAYLFCR